MSSQRPSPPVTVAEEIGDPRLIVVSREPFNAETPLAEQAGLITPNRLFYVRNHFPIPACTNPAAWRITIDGEVERPLELTYQELLSLPSRSLLVTLECAGNGRSFLEPKTGGDQWRYGAAATAEWTGVPLGTVLAAAGLTSSACEIVVEGADRGFVAAAGDTIAFARSLGLKTALHSDTLLAYAMNGEPLPAAHGFPVRLIVPGWYGMASVKWVTRLRAIASSFDGFYQARQYVMVKPESGETARTPLTTMRARSLITAPEAGIRLERGRHCVRGLAWSGAAPVTRVEVSVDGGETWEPAEFASGPERYAWRRWNFIWEATAAWPATLRSRAFDADGNGQPDEPEWNQLGYANNAIQVIEVVVE